MDTATIATIRCNLIKIVGPAGMQPENTTTYSKCPKVKGTYINTCVRCCLATCTDSLAADGSV